MSDPTFMARLAEAIQQQHAATIVLQQLASELVDHAMRMRSWTDKLQSHLVAPETPARARQDGQYGLERGLCDCDAPLVLPRMLQGGPQRDR